MSAYPSYAKYRERSDWLPPLPEHWASKRVAALYKRVKRTNFPHEQLLSVYRDYGVVPKASRDDNNNKASDDLATYQLVKRGDLALNKMKAWQGSLAVSSFQGIVSPAYFVYSPLESACHSQFPGYSNYLLRSPLYVSHFLSRSKGIRVNQWDLDPDEFRTTELVQPSLEEQKTIAAFLDYETAKIDQLIAKQQRLIALLKEKRQAVISHAVTKGLNPNAPMKDSGVEWLGEVPEYWLVGSLGYYSTIESGATPDRANGAYWNGKVPWVKTGEVAYKTIFETEEYVTDKALLETSLRLSPEGTLLMAMYGQGVTRGRVALLGVAATYNQACAAITLGQRILGQFAEKYLMAAYSFVREGGNETSQMNLNTSQIAKFPIVVPPIDEQKKIVLFVNEKLECFGQLENRSNDAIKLLKERRSALISAAVTGKIDVRGWQPPAAANSQ